MALPALEQVLAGDQGSASIPSTWFVSLATDMKLSGVEWRVLALVIAAGPLPATSIARRLRMRYTNAKRAVRELLRCRLVTRSAAGLTFQPERERWGSGTVPSGREAARAPSKTPTLEVESEIEVPA
jgi:predicted transcriptional regulator